MRTRQVLITALTALAAGGLIPAAPAAARGGERFDLAGGCYGLRSASAGQFVAKGDGGGYRASAAGVGQAEPFRMQATDLGRYLFYGRAKDFMAGSGSRVESAARPSDAADWRVDEAEGGNFEIVLPSARKALATSPSGQLVLVEESAAGRFGFERAEGCPVYPEIEVTATGEPATGPTSYGQVEGFVDAHLHMMAFEFLGGSVRCGRPWHRFGVAFALVDCPDHEPGGAGAVLENTISRGTPAGTHDTVGWPTFRDWPAYRSLTHEQIYYKWLERAHKGGLRMFVNLLVDNAVLCEVYPLKRNSCNEMDSVRLQIARINELQDYIDAQEGGPGEGWFRIVKDPFEARRVINDGKLAVVLGIENSKLFDCGVSNDVPECDRAQIDRQIDEMYAAGVRSMELVNKFDNALAGVAGDEGNTGLAVNSANRYETGRFWQMETCDPKAHAESGGHAHDREQYATPGANRDQLAGAVSGMFLPPGSTPAYPEPPHCNARGLTPLGAYTIRRMVEKGMIFDPDHMSVAAREQALSVIESLGHSGVISSHSWSTLDSMPRIYRQGGMVTPYAGDSEKFVKAWRETKPLRDDRYFFGFGYGADTNGFGGQGAPRGKDAPNPVTYPFKSLDGRVTLDRQRSGERVHDINVDGVAHYGLYADWIQDLRNLAGDEIVQDMAKGSEAYLQMWERTVGVPNRSCQEARRRFTSRGLGPVGLRASAERLLRSASQPLERPGRVFRWCGKTRDGRPAGQVTAVLTRGGTSALVASTGPEHRARGIGRGARAKRVPRRARTLGAGVRVLERKDGTAFVYRVRKGRVRATAVAARSVARSPKRLRAYLRLAGV